MYTSDHIIISPFKGGQIKFARARCRSCGKSRQVAYKDGRYYVRCGACNLTTDLGEDIQACTCNACTREATKSV